MILFKNKAETMEGVLRNQKHATENNLQFEPGEIILIQQTITSLPSKKDKSIKWIMDYVRTYPDINGESHRIWGKDWKYIIEGKNLRTVEGFNIKELQVSEKDYGSAMIYANVLSEDEEIILDWIGENYSRIIEVPESGRIAEEFALSNNLKDIHELIEALNRRYAGKPTYNKNISYSINRPTAYNRKIKKCLIQN